jgi:subtilisin family serine protease
LDKLVANSKVAYLGFGDAVHFPDAPLGEVADHGANVVADIPSTSRRKGGHKVLVGIIDVGGFDFAHQDFIDEGKTRFLEIWDQGAESNDPPAGFDYGHVITRDDMNAAIGDAPAVGVNPHDLEPQTQHSRHSHGTHVASIAAGKSGVAKGFDIAGVLLDMPASALARRSSFYDSTRIAHAVDYLFQLKDDKGYEAISINISLGTNGHAHDGSAPVCRWVDSALTEPGRSIAVAAGNSGQEAPRFEGDSGFVFGRIHTSGHIEATGLEHLLFWQVVGNGIEDISENELEIWYPPQDRLAVQLRPPGGEWLDIVEPGQYDENQMLAGGSFYSVYNDIYHEDNGHNTLSIYLTPFLSTTVIGVPAGVWTVRLIGRDIRDGRFDGWIERDDPRRLGKIGDKEYWRFPSFFTTTSNVDQSSISSLACAHNVIGVANADMANEAINVTSSQGPTRDGREKPDMCAPGTNILAASGFDGGDEFIQMSGTSMASPYVAGAVALMLSHEPNLTAAQIRGILQSTARPFPGASYQWRDDSGFGLINIERCITEARFVREREDMHP